MNFDEYMKCHNTNNGYIDNNFGMEDPCYGNNDPEDFDEMPMSCNYCCNCNCNCDCDNNHGDPDEECIDNGLDKNQCWKPDEPQCIPQSGTLNFASKLDCAQGEPLSNAPVSLYKVENGCEKLVGTKKTDKNGNATFNCLEDGVYRAEQKLDPCLFECAQYYPTAHFAIKKGHKTQKMVVVHKRRQLVDPCTMRAINQAVNAAVKKALCCRCRCK